MYRRSLDTLARYSLAQIVAPLIAFAFTTANARQMSVETYGLLTVLITANGFMALFAGGWLDRTLLRFAPSSASPRDISRALGAVSLLGGMGLVLAGAGAAAAASLGWLPLSGGLSAFLAAFFAQTVTAHGLMALYRARGDTAIYPLTTLIVTIAYAGGGFVAFRTTGSLEALLWTWAAAWALVGVFVALRLRAEGLLPRPSLSVDTVRVFLMYGLPLLAASIGSLCLDQADRFVLARFIGPREVGLYSVGYLFGGYVLSGIGSIFTAAGYPHLIATWEQDGEDSAKTLLARLTRLYILCALPAAAGVSLLSRRLIEAFLGAKYAEAAPIVFWIAGAYFISGLNQYEQAAAQLRRRTWLAGAVYALCAAGNLLMNVVLVPRFGIAGAAWATFAGFGGLFMLTSAYNRHLLEFDWKVPRETWIRASLATACMAAAVYSIDRYLPVTNGILLVAILSGMGVYAFALHILGELQAPEYAALRSLVERTGFAHPPRMS